MGRDVLHVNKRSVPPDPNSSGTHFPDTGSTLNSGVMSLPSLILKYWQNVCPAWLGPFVTSLLYVGVVGISMKTVVVLIRRNSVHAGFHQSIKISNC